jgi:flagellar assembly protein FliH
MKPTIIHAARLREPVLLLRKVGERAPAAAQPPTVQAEAAVRMQPATPQISYDEYRSRFRVELDALRAEAREGGWQEGREAGLAKAMAEHGAQLESLAALVRSLRRRLDEGIGELSQLGAEVVYEAVCKLLGQALATREGVSAAVREVVRRARDRTRLVLRVSTADYPMIREHLATILEGLETGQVEVAADERVELGGCLLETAAGHLDGRLETQLANLRQALLAARGAQPESPAK